MIEDQRDRYSVRLVFRVEATGKPVAVDGAYDAGLVMVEERIVMVPADSCDEAIALAEVEAHEYANDYAHTNPYGQSVTCKYLDLAEAYLVPDFVEFRYQEVFSSTRVVARESATGERIADSILGPADPAVGCRRKFLNAEFNSRVEE